MEIPAKRVCDMCRTELTTPYVAMSYPLNETERAALTQKIEPPGPLRAFVPEFVHTPNSWRFDFCLGCAEGFMPMLEDLKTTKVKQWLEERARKETTVVEE